MCISCQKKHNDTEVKSFKLALWCRTCNSAEELSSGLCQSHYKLSISECQYCYFKPDQVSCSWRPCGTENCPRSVHACNKCVSRARGGKLLCNVCWREAGSLCIVCGETGAQTAKRYMHCCKGCISGVDPAAHYELVREESERYLESISVQQQWTGLEQAFQILVLPDTQAPALPQYAETPEYLDPEHCRLCLQPYKDTGLERHLQEQHQISLEEYRQRAFRRTLTEWPQPISPQILRSRLAAFKRELSDFNFLMLSCAVCARQKRRCKLTAATFPPKNATSAPA